MHILVLNGPNLNLTGRREPHLYGTQSFERPEVLFRPLTSRYPDLKITLFQSNHEGELIERIQQAERDGFQGIILNPGGFTHTSVAIADALRAIPIPVVEVHLSHIYAREEFRRHNLVAGACRGSISGLGVTGYRLAAEFLLTETA